MRKKRDVELLFEVGAMRFQPRQWQRFLGIPFANISEHHYRVIWLALIIAAQEGISNTDKIIKMALSHDFAESRTGDVDYISRQYVTRDEKQGISDIFANTSLETEFINIIDEYEKRESIESKIVKDADNLDVDLELREQAANGVSIEKTFKIMRDQVMENKLYTQSAKKLANEIRLSDPHDWHIKAQRNRINGGDWKQK